MNVLRVLAAVAAAAPASAQYAGPAILTRGEAPTAVRGVPVSFRPFLSLRGVYDTGLAGVSPPDNGGQLAQGASAGIEAQGGISGSHAWRHTLLGLDYSFSARHYLQRTFYDGTDHSFGLGLTRQVSRHWQLRLRESAGLLSRDFGMVGLSSTVPFDPVGSYVPLSDFFDNRTLYLSSQADVTYIRSNRLSFNFGGDFFLADRRSKALYDTTGESARGDVQYRVSRYQTVGVNYLYSHFRFGQGFGSTDLHSVVGTYSIRLTRRSELSVYGGGYRYETKYIQSVPIDPIIAAIIGVGFGREIRYLKDYTPNYGGRISRSFQNGVVSATASRTVTPGNGLFLTSTNNNVAGQISYNGVRRWSFSAQVDYTRSGAVSNVVGEYSSRSAGLSAGRTLFRSLHGVAEFSVRKYSSGDFNAYNRLIYRGTIGFTWAPGALPVRVW